MTGNRLSTVEENDVGTVTLGVSIAVPEPYGSLLQDRRASFGDPAAFGIPTHVTLLPPTEAESADLPAIEAHLDRIATAGRPFPMRLSGTGTFRPLSPVVFVQVAAGASACAWLQKRVRDASGPLVRELQFPYHPHVTVAHGIAEEAMDRAYEELADYEAAWTCGSFSLYEQGPDAVWRNDQGLPVRRGRRGARGPRPGRLHDRRAVGPVATALSTRGRRP
ncbi:2'-5' RNA ligase [Streptomyces sp. HB372]|nr:2'-5' RNA ligase [Streptomyces sp. HB372]